MLEFQIGERYSRGDVKEVAGIPRDSIGGPWHTGVLEHDRQFLIFTNVGTSGRTGHDYGNQWEGSLLRWYHKRDSHLGWSSVRRLLEPDRAVHVFWRGSNTEPFEYAGYGSAIDVIDVSPVEILWSFSDRAPDMSYFLGADEVPSSDYSEGSVRRVSVNLFERDRAARQACVEHYGPMCVVCNLAFEDRYGDIGAGYCHVHHLVPIAEVKSSYQVDPIKDLRPICPNCHAMVHRRRPPYTPGEVRAMLRE